MRRPRLRLVEPPRSAGDSFANRILGVVKLQEPVYSEIKRDPAALNQAMLVVLLSALAGGIMRSR